MTTDWPTTLLGYPVVIDASCKEGWRLELGDLSRYMYPHDVYFCDEHFEALGDCWEYTIPPGLIAFWKCSQCEETATHMCDISDVKAAADRAGIKITFKEVETMAAG